MRRRAERRDDADQQRPEREGGVRLAHAEVDRREDGRGHDAANRQSDGVDDDILEDDERDGIEQTPQRGEERGVSTEALKAR